MLKHASCLSNCLYVVAFKIVFYFKKIKLIFFKIFLNNFNILLNIKHF